MHTIGIIGGIASGKSLVAAYFAELGAGVLDADRAGHEVLEMPEVKRAIGERCGDAVFDTEGRIDRKALARRVFGAEPESQRDREFLEKLTHPLIQQRLAGQAEAYAQAGKKAAILDAPLLLEAGWDKLSETLVFVEAPREQRMARAAARGWRHEDVAARESSQWPIEQKRRRADVVIDNSGTPRQTRDQVVALWRRLFG
jgi:dephospho-CoA kinase